MENARNFSQSYLAPKIIVDNRKEYFDPEIMREMGKQGFLGCTISEYDLPGVSYTSYGIYTQLILLFKL
jgi:glutaryl-CoA dehydrogenase